MPDAVNSETRDVVVRALKPYGTSIFTEMTGLAITHGAVNLSQGFPDLDGPEKIRHVAARAIVRGPNQYAPSIGIPSFRQAIARKMSRFYGVDVDPDTEVTVTSGATEGLCATLLAILEPGDEVILIEPWYESYPPIAVLTGARLRYVSLRLPDFGLPEEEISRAFNSRTKAVLINTPHNPSGKVFTRKELALIGRLCRDYDAYAIGDEVYEHLVYGDREHVTLLDIPELRDRSFVISSTAKTFSMTGWKQGWVIAAPDLSRAVRMTHQFITFCGQGPLQEAMAFALNLPDEYYENFLADSVQKRDLLCCGLEEAGFKVLPPEGTYYVQADIRPLGYDDDLEFCRMLPEKAGVSAIPSSVFWENRNHGRELIRFCFCKSRQTLEEGIRRLRKRAGR